MRPLPRIRRMVKWGGGAALCVIAGAAASISLAMLAPRYLPRTEAFEFAQDFNTKERSWALDYYIVHPPSGTRSGAEGVQFARHILFQPDKHHFEGFWSGPREDETFFPGGTCELLDVGFPFRCLSGWRYQYYTPPRWDFISRPPRDESGLLDFAAVKPSDGPESRWIPYSPLWFGFAGDAIAWGSPIWLCVFGTAALRRTRRRRRGLCVRCGYDLAGLALDSTCPECGGK